MERFILKKLNDVAVKEECQAKISNTFAGLENFQNDEVGISNLGKSPETIRKL
jgi:hypothetical protein